MSRTIEDMRNLGPVMARMLAEIDIHSEDDLRAADAVAAYARLKFQFGRSISILALYAMDAALRDEDLRALDAEAKSALQRQVAGAEDAALSGAS